MMRQNRKGNILGIYQIFQQQFIVGTDAAACSEAGVHNQGAFPVGKFQNLGGNWDHRSAERNS